MSTIIISESQLRVLYEHENERVVIGEFETALNNYFRELKENPNHPKLDGFFKENGISEVELQNKMMDLGLISRKDNIIEPEDAEGKKHSMHTRQFTRYNKNYNANVKKLFDTFFKDGKRTALNEDEGAVGGDAGGFAGGALTDSGLNVGTADTSAGIAVPFGKVQRRKIGAKYSDDITKQDSNVDMSPALSRDTEHGISVNRQK